MFVFLKRLCNLLLAWCLVAFCIQSRKWCLLSETIRLLTEIDKKVYSKIKQEVNKRFEISIRRSVYACKRCRRECINLYWGWANRDLQTYEENIFRNMKWRLLVTICEFRYLLKWFEHLNIDVLFVLRETTANSLIFV